MCKFAVLLLIGLTLAIFFVGCNSSATQTTPIVPTPIEKPDFLIGVGPTGILRISDYIKSFSFGPGRGIEVVIKPYLCKYENTLDCDLRGISVFIDDQLVPNDSLQVIDGGYYYYSWAVELEPGMHTVRFMFTRDSGEILEYSWQFYLTEE